MVAKDKSKSADLGGLELIEGDVYIGTEENPTQKLLSEYLAEMAPKAPTPHAPPPKIVEEEDSTSTSSVSDDSLIVVSAPRFPSGTKVKTYLVESNPIQFTKTTDYDKLTEFVDALQFKAEAQPGASEVHVGRAYIGEFEGKGSIFFMKTFQMYFLLLSQIYQVYIRHEF